ncbi:MAG: hypothetical protein V8Q58_07810 [Anaerobutyricum hallii]|uniref:hypothetical protein n=1 Tax=Anaerobutyricum hallii TaxID=39488 RepID=UPI00300F5625
MLKIFISKDTFYDEKELTIMAVLNGLYRPTTEYLVTSIQEIGYILLGRWIDIRNKDRRFYNNLREGIESLAERGLITILDQNGDNYVISNEGLTIDTEKVYFALIELWEMQKIFRNATKPFNIFQFFVRIIGTINNTTKEWHMSQDEMTECWQYGKGTVNKYLTELENLELIYVYRHKRRKADGTYHKLNNSYGRFADKKEIIMAAGKYADSVECEKFYENNIDRRSIKLRYNAFCDGSKKYENMEEVKKLYADCLKYNKSIKLNPVSGTYDGEYKEGGELDLSMFSELEVDCEIESVWGEQNPLEQINMEDIFEIETA